MSEIKVKIKRLPNSAGLSLPRQASRGASGFDLVACLDAEVALAPGEFKLVPAGICVEIPEGFEGQVRPRSGLALKNGVTVLNTPGTIDSDYRGEVAVILINLGNDTFTVRRGDRIAQMVFTQVCRPVFEESDSLEDTGRGAGGFGHSGL
ncbi:MAG TPA: dUTP diphosphatase [bacterium]|nr:dUTP diphosphatase [bacterium]